MGTWEAVQQAALEPSHTQEQMKAFLTPDPNAHGRIKNLYALADRSHIEDAGAVRTSYAMDLVEQEGLSRDAAVGVLAGCRTKKLSFTLHALTIAARLYPRMNASAADEARWSHRLCSVVAGLDTGPARPLHRVDTEAGLAAAAAVVQCVMELPKDNATRVFNRELGEAEQGRMIANPHLDRLVRERPDDVDRIISYVRERGMHPKRRRDVDELREWLDMGVAAVAEGWL